MDLRRDRDRGRGHHRPGRGAGVLTLSAALALVAIDARAADAGCGGGSRTPVGPTVTFAPVVVRHGEGLDKAIIRRYLKRNIAKFVYCFEKQLVARPRLRAGTVTLSFTITVDGKLAEVGAKGFDKEVAACDLAAWQPQELPKPKDGQPVVASVVLTYKAAP